MGFGEGLVVGVNVGDFVGPDVGSKVGDIVGEQVGALVGLQLGRVLALGADVGCPFAEAFDPTAPRNRRRFSSLIARAISDGDAVVGFFEGSIVGVIGEGVPNNVGCAVAADGFTVGRAEEGDSVGCMVGGLVGCKVG